MAITTMVHANPDRDNVSSMPPSSYRDNEGGVGNEQRSERTRGAQGRGRPSGKDAHDLADEAWSVTCATMKPATSAREIVGNPAADVIAGPLR